MKKWSIFALALVLAISMLGCSSQQQEPNEPETTVPTEEVETVEIEEEEPEQPEKIQETESTEETDETEDTEEEALEVVEEAPEVVELFSSVSETVYATTTVNVRDTYSASGNQLGSLTTAQSVTRTGIGTGAAEGWSRIEFNGAEAYVKSDYLSTTKPVTSTSSSGNSSSGNSGSTTTKPSGGSSTTTSKPSTPNTPSGGSSTTTPPPANDSSMSQSDYLQALEESLKNNPDVIMGDGGGEVIDASGSYVEDWDGGSFVFGDDGTITIVP